MFGKWGNILHSYDIRSLCDMSLSAIKYIFLNSILEINIE